MPVTTRSKRKSLNTSTEVPNKSRRAIKLVDVTNKNKTFDEKSEKPPFPNQKNCDSVLNTSKPNITEEVKLKPLNSSLKSSDSYDSLQSQKSQTNIDYAFVVMKGVKKVLGIKIKDLSERLQLDFKPDCIYDVDNCQHDHNADILPLKITPENIFLAKLFIDEERHFNFFQFIRRGLIAQNIFPGSEICLCIIKEIMKFKSKDNQLSTSFVLSELHHVFITIVNKFPPCKYQNSYLQVFKSLIKIDGVPDKKQILPTLLDIIHDLIYVSEKDTLDESFKIDFNKNFYLWDCEHNDNSSFSSLSRNDRFNRVFLVLDILVRILEYDTAMFFIKNFDQFASIIKGNKKKPLICSVIWQEFAEILTINGTVKKIIKSFITMTALDYPAEKIKIFSRLLNLIINIMNMCEYPNKITQYPIYKNFTLVISNEIQKSIESSNYYSIDLLINVINNIRSPLIRMLLSNQVYLKIIGQQNLPISLTIPFKSIYNRDFLKFDKESEKQKVNAKNEKYPRYDAKRSPKISKIYQNHFIKIMMLYTNAVIQNFHLHDIVNNIKNDELKAWLSDAEMKFQPLNFDDFEKEIKNIDLNEKVHLRTIDLNFHTFQLRLTKDNCTFYRNEIKHFSLIIKLIKRCQRKYGSQFDEWMESLDKFQ